MRLRKDDPVYYKVKIEELLDKAVKNDITIITNAKCQKDVISHRVELQFHNKIGEIVACKLR